VARLRESFKFVVTNHIAGTAKAKVVKFCTQVDYNITWLKIDKTLLKGAWLGSRNPFFKFCPNHVFGNGEALRVVQTKHGDLTSDKLVIFDFIISNILKIILPKTGRRSLHYCECWLPQILILNVLHMYCTPVSYDTMIRYIYVRWKADGSASLI